MNLIQTLEKEGLISPPKWLGNNTIYLCVMGSEVYGAAKDSSDMDIYGITIPPIQIVFPHLTGEIAGFGKEGRRFHQYQQHSIKKRETVYDITIYNIVKYFSLTMENNPNMLDSLFVPQRCVIYSTESFNILRENRKLFLSKKAWPKFKGYAYSQLSKIKKVSRLTDITKYFAMTNGYIIHDNSYFDKNGEVQGLAILNGTIVPIEELSPRLQAAMDNGVGYDTKFAYHLVRLLLEVEQILTTGDLILDNNGPMLKSIRNGEWSYEQVKEYFSAKEKSLENVYNNSTVPAKPNEDKIKNVLIQMLEAHYGSLDKVIPKNTSQKEETLHQIISILKESGLV